ncbi:hypothetical protein HD593_009955 [Nonomuraea rubra]|uniref:Uncharacterized protein n=1 Tax=Nonomuraea rubra TaxID=46180 RepID=A0A7X0P4N6_9ACTN|nr:hypothetical protein [Nonomuraea rubra]
MKGVLWRYRHGADRRVETATPGAIVPVDDGEVPEFTHG